MEDPPPPLRRAARCRVAGVAVQVAAVLVAATAGPGPGGVLTVAAVLASFHPTCSAFLRTPRGRSTRTDG